MSARQLTAEQRCELVIRRLIAVEEARDNLLRFTQLTMPTPKEPDDPDKSLYDAQRFHKVMAAALEELEKGTYQKLIINIGPRHGKTQLASKSFIAWYVGRNPMDSVIFGTYNDKFAEDIGRAVRDIIRHPAYRQVFPDVQLKDDSQSASRLQTTDGGVLAFVGRGGTTTGRGGNLLVVDDPVKDRSEADSPTIRDSMWTWFTQVLGTRMIDDKARTLVIQTRWHQDDIVGRLTDPTNDFYDAEEAASWKVIDLPALAREDDVLGRKPGEALWPQRFGVPFLLGQQRVDPRGFSALYQGRPSPDQGTFFRAEWLKTYRTSALPKHLRIYAASDHAVSMKQGRDKTCLLGVGVDQDENIWVLPDLVWRQMTADVAVDAMLKMMERHKPLFWWAERGVISKSLGPFLRKRMLEEGVFSSVVEITPVADKQTRAQSIQGRMAMGKVYFPENTAWWGDARDQLLRFPMDAHDDFVDALAYIGLGLAQQVGMSPIKRKTVQGAGTFGALLAERRRAERSTITTGGW